MYLLQPDFGNLTLTSCFTSFQHGKPNETRHPVCLTILSGATAADLSTDTFQRIQRVPVELGESRLLVTRECHGSIALTFVICLFTALDWPTSMAQADTAQAFRLLSL